jgi:hypothetical protein
VQSSEAKESLHLHGLKEIRRLTNYNNSFGADETQSRRRISFINNEDACTL